MKNLFKSLPLCCSLLFIFFTACDRNVAITELEPENLQNVQESVSLKQPTEIPAELSQLPKASEKKFSEKIEEEITAEKFNFKRPTRNFCEGKSCFNNQEFIQGTPFYLKGIGKRMHLVFDVYTAAFYLSDQKRQDEYGVPIGAKMIILEYNRTVKKKKVVESIIANVGANPNADAPYLRPRFDQFSDAFDTPHDKSRYYFVYVPGQGTSMIKNGETRITIPGDDFAQAFFGMWFHEKTENVELREKLLKSH
jgi:hypothetical protein